MRDLTYRQVGDYMVPNLEEESQPEGELRKYGNMRKDYLKARKPWIYSNMLLDGKLKAHLLLIQEQAEAREKKLIQDLAASQGITEELKEQNQLSWVGAMNNIKTQAEEMVVAEIINS